MTTPLAIDGGTPVRTQPMPPRRLFGEAELAAVETVFRHSWETGIDFGFQGEAETAYTDAFCQLQGGGFADAMASGTLATFVALQALDLPAGSEVLCSPVTDPGAVSAILLAGHQPRLTDAAPHGWNVGPTEFSAACTPTTRAAIVTHVGGVPVDMPPIVTCAARCGVVLLEDCSQAHGATLHGQAVGTFGTLAIFSTMFSKLHATGGCGGLVYTRDAALYRHLRARADRGKPFWEDGFAPRHPDTFRYPALNCNLDELSCAIGHSTLRRLPEFLAARRRIVQQLDSALRDLPALQPVATPPGAALAPFFYTVCVDAARINVPPRRFADAVRAEGVPLNPDYRYVVAEWDWVQPHLPADQRTPNATAFRQQAFNILFHERFADRDVRDIIAALHKVAAVYQK